MDKVVFTSEPLSSSNQTTLDLQDEVGEVLNTSVEMSRPPTPPTLNICTDLDCNPDGCHEVLSSQPPSSGSFDPLDFTVLCSPVLDSTSVFHDDQVVNGVGG